MSELDRSCFAGAAVKLDCPPRPSDYRLFAKGRSDCGGHNNLDQEPSMKPSSVQMFSGQICAAYTERST